MENKIKIAFIIKTDINTDGRVLNELQILQNKFRDIHIDFIILPDKPVHVDLGEAVSVHEIKCRVRHSRFLKGVTALEFYFKSIKMLFQIKPDIIHAQDSSVVLPVLLYMTLKRKRPSVIYDDHEIPNENIGLRGKINSYFENLLSKKADAVIFANQERMDLIKERLGLKNRLIYLLNLPYFQSKNNTQINDIHKKQLRILDKEKETGTKFILHQGPIHEQRGRHLLADFSDKLPKRFKILLLGGNEKDFLNFLEEYDLDITDFHFVGTVDYNILEEYWKRASASIVMYLPQYINNRLCAPNRFYLSLENKIPVIVNRDNPVLSTFVENLKCGFYIDQFKENNFHQIIDFDHHQIDFSYQKLRSEQLKSFENLYQSLLSQ